MDRFKPITKRNRDRNFRYQVDDEDNGEHHLQAQAIHVENEITNRCMVQNAAKLPIT